MAVSGAREVTALWISYENGPGGIVHLVRAKQRSSAGVWESQAEELTDEGLASWPTLATNQAGDVVAAWEVQGKIWAASRPAGEGWDSPIELGAGHNAPYLALDSQAEAVAVWESLDGKKILISTRNALGTWLGPTPLVSVSGDAEVGRPWVGVDSQDVVTALWAREDDEGLVGEAARRVGATWSPAGELPVDPRPRELPAVGLDLEGNTVVAWTGSNIDSGPWSGVTSTLDVNGPELRDIVVPAEATAGKAVQMSVNPFDSWSTLSTTWNFGDGGEATGSVVTHTFHGEGQRTVTISSIDFAGNITQATRALTVKAAPKPDPDNGGPEDRGDKGGSKACLAAKKKQKQLRLSVGQAKKKVARLQKKAKRAKTKRAAKRARSAAKRWRGAQKRRQKALRSANKWTALACSQPMR